MTIEQFAENSVSPPVRGFLHTPDREAKAGLVLTHGAGGNCQSPLLLALAEAFADAGFAVLRCNLPFRQQRSYGPPRPAEAETDRRGLASAVGVLAKHVEEQVFLGGHSYGGRQATMLCTAEPQLTSGLLLLSYPLHPPRRPEKARAQHLPNLRTPALFVHGTRDPFGSIEEMTEALSIIPARTQLLPVQGAGHDLGFKGKSRIETLPGEISRSSGSLLRYEKLKPVPVLVDPAGF